MASPLQPILLLLLLLFLILSNSNMANFTGDASDSDYDADYTPAGKSRIKPRLFTVKLAPQAVVDWYKISLDKSTARRNSAVKEDALGHLLAMGWKIYPIQKKTKQELRYKSPNDRVYISLRTACKAYIDQHNAAAAPTVAVSEQSQPLAVATVPPLKKHKECVKSPVRNWGNKISSRTAAARGNACNADIDETDAAAVPTTLISIKPAECVKSPMRNCGNKKSPPSTACETDIDQAAAAVAVPTTASVGEGKESVPFLKKPEECNKSPSVSPKRNWGNKKPPPPTASKSDIDQVSAATATAAVPTTASIDEGKQPIPSSKKPKQCIKSPSLNWGNKKPPAPAAARGNRNPRTALFHLIEQGIVSPGEKAYYRIGAAKEDPLTAWGTITNEGLIKCDCCSESFSISKFEAHTGSTKHRPAANIFLEDGRSLLDCQKQLAHNHHNDPKVQNDKNDSVCSICNFGGELILCDLCPAAFHSTCLGFNGIPFGDWFCPSCICKICGQVPYNFDGVCPNHHELDSSFVKCVQCEQSVHIGCVKNIQLLEDNSDQSIDVTNWFCTKSCEDIHIGLQELLWKQIPLPQQQDHNLTWTLMKHTNTMAEQHRKKLDVALAVMCECFQPVKDPITENDIIHDVIFSTRSDVKRLNFGGFYTVVLEMNNIVTTVATVRVYGDEVAEVPFVATRLEHQRRGLCRMLMSELELLLMKLGVKRLTLPAVDEALDTWTNGFGFSKMTDSDKLEFVKYTFLGFQHTVRCHKNLEIRRIINQNDLEWEPRKKVKQTELEEDFFSYMCLDNWNSISDAF